MNKDSSLCISVASNPGNFGAMFHNEAYKNLDMNWFYLPRKIDTSEELKKAIDGVRVFGIKGCSVSMPHKETVVNLINELDPSASKIGAVNTIVNNDGILKGYNTDFYGAMMSLEKANISGKNVLLVGAGGVAKAVGLAVKELGGTLKIANRTYKKAVIIAERLKAEVVSWDEINNTSAHILINATSVGMMNPKEMIIDKDFVDNFDYIMDVVIYPPKSKLLRTAKSLGKQIIPGTLMCVFQAARQFKLYTGIDAPSIVINNTLNSFK